MKSVATANVRYWTLNSPHRDLRRRVERLAAMSDVLGIAVFPDAHLTEEYCVGTTVATQTRILPTAVGSDIGCGMTSVRFASDVAFLKNRRVAERLLKLIKRIVPVNRRRSSSLEKSLPRCVADYPLSDGRLEAIARRDGRVQLGTLGRGNHFIEFQADELGQLWVLVHSGSRGMGQAITDFHLPGAESDLPVASFVAESNAGQAYLNDVGWAINFAHQNRLQMIWMIAEVLQQVWRIELDNESMLTSNHNHVRRESHQGKEIWAHRKGAQPAHKNVPGIIPGSMGTATYHIVGRGVSEAFASCSHGAGRSLSRTQAAQTIELKDFRRAMQRVIFDRQRERSLIDEAPAAYNDIHEVIRKQKQLIRVSRRLRPLLNFKG